MFKFDIRRDQSNYYSQNLILNTSHPHELLINRCDFHHTLEKWGIEVHLGSPSLYIIQHLEFHFLYCRVSSLLFEDKCQFQLELVHYEISVEVAIESKFGTLYGQIIGVGQGPHKLKVELISDEVEHFKGASLLGKGVEERLLLFVMAGHNN